MTEARDSATRGSAEPRLAVELEVASVPDEEFVAHAYRLLLRREPEPEALLAFLRENQFRSLITRVEAKLGRAGPERRDLPVVS